MSSVASDINDEMIAVVGDYLCVKVGRCTCDGPFDAVPGVDHRDGCGYEPVATLDEIEKALRLAGRTVVEPAPRDQVEQTIADMLTAHEVGAVGLADDIVDALVAGELIVLAASGSVGSETPEPADDYWTPEPVKNEAVAEWASQQPELRKPGGSLTHKNGDSR